MMAPPASPPTTPPIFSGVWGPKDPMDASSVRGCVVEEGLTVGLVKSVTSELVEEANSEAAIMTEDETGVAVETGAEIEEVIPLLSVLRLG